MMRGCTLKCRRTRVNRVVCAVTAANGVSGSGASILRLVILGSYAIKMRECEALWNVLVVVAVVMKSWKAQLPDVNNALFQIYWDP